MATLSWRETLETNPSLRSMKNWPTINPDHIHTKYRKIFLRNMEIVADVLSGESVLKTSRKFNLSPSSISRTIDKALRKTEAGTPKLTAGLIPYSRKDKHHRRTKIDSFASRKGHQCSFKYLLNVVPNLKQNLDKQIYLSVKKNRSGQISTPKSLHGEFKRVLAEAHWPIDQYPYTTQNCAKEAVRLYFHQRKAEIEIETSSAFENYNPRQKIYRAFREIQIDAKKTDLETAIHLTLNDELVPLRISQATILKAICVSTNCILGYHLSFRDEPNQDDILQLSDNMTKQWTQLKLETPGLFYVPGSGFPSMLGGVFDHITFEKIHLDNALAHLAHTVRDVFCKKHGATLCLGIPGVPETRNWIEASFRFINQITHRFPSTKGSHPTDPIKEPAKNRKNPPAVTMKEFEECLSVAISAHNITPRAELAGSTPLDLVKSHFSNHYIRISPLKREMKSNPFYQESICKVIKLKTERRNPFIRFLYVKYSGSALNKIELIGKKIRLSYDRRDIRKLDAYTLDGQFLGELKAPISWQRFKHGVQTRKIIYEAAKEWKFHSMDYLSEYFYLLYQNRHKPGQALELVRVYREANMILPIVAQAPKKSEGVGGLGTNKGLPTLADRSGVANNAQNDDIDLDWSTVWANSRSP